MIGIGECSRLEERVGHVRHPAYLVSSQGSCPRVARCPRHDRVVRARNLPPGCGVETVVDSARLMMVLSGSPTCGMRSDSGERYWVGHLGEAEKWKDKGDKVQGGVKRDSWA